MNNSVKVYIQSKLENIAFARTICSSFLININPTITFIDELKTVISEAVTNSIVHGYENRTNKEVILELEYDDEYVYLKVIDYGVGIENVEKAKEPLFSSKFSEERAGLGFTIMEIFTDYMTVKSSLGNGTTVELKKRYKKEEYDGQ